MWAHGCHTTVYVCELTCDSAHDVYVISHVNHECYLGFENLIFGICKAGWNFKSMVKNHSFALRVTDNFNDVN